MIIPFTGNVTDNVSKNLTLLDETGGNNMKKKVLALVLALVMSLALVACGGNDDNQTPSTGDQTPSTGDQTPSTDNQTPGDDTQTPAGDSQTPAASGRVYWLNFKPESEDRKSVV